MVNSVDPAREHALLPSVRLRKTLRSVFGV